jgi:MerR family transcriptional regulator, repressor of the yfmOP operon
MAATTVTSRDRTSGSTEHEGPLLGISAAAARAGVSERALRYYQERGLITPSGCTPGGLRRYSEDDLARVARIRQLQALLGLNLDEIALVLRNEDRIAQIRSAYYQEQTSDAQRQALAEESLQLKLELRETVQAKRAAIDGFLADLDARITRTRDLLAEMRCGHPGGAARPPQRGPANGGSAPG